ncbi:MAG: hypothetical protein AB4352_15190 [Hormoscilla sp.]
MFSIPLIPSQPPPIALDISQAIAQVDVFDPQIYRGGKTVIYPEFVLSTHSLSFDGLKTRPTNRMGDPFNISFYDWNSDGKKAIVTVQVTPTQYHNQHPKFAIDGGGRAYQLSPTPDYVKVDGTSVMSSVPLNWYGKGPVVALGLRSRTFMIPLLPKTNYRQSIEEIEKLGGKVLGFLGTAFKGFEAKTNRPMPLYYTYLNLNNYQGLNGEKEKYPVYRSSEIAGQSAPNILLSGIVTYRDGHTEYLDFSHLKGTGNTPDERLESIKKQMRKHLEKLEGDRDVVQLTIDTHGVIRKPADIAAVFTRGGGKRGGLFLFYETQSVGRAARVFNNKTKEFLASIITPSLKMEDVLTVAKRLYGENAVVQFLDGDTAAAAQFTREDPTKKLHILDDRVVNEHRFGQVQGLQLIVYFP